MEKAKRAFKVYKEGTTDNWVYVLMADRLTGKPEQWTEEKMQQKIEFYKSMGYTVELS